MSTDHAKVIAFIIFLITFPTCTFIRIKRDPISCLKPGVLFLLLMLAILPFVGNDVNPQSRHIGSVTYIVLIAIASIAAIAWSAKFRR